MHFLGGVGLGLGGTRLEMFEMFDMSLRSSQQSRLSPYSSIKGDSIDSITILKLLKSRFWLFNMSIVSKPSKSIQMFHADLM